MTDEPPRTHARPREGEGTLIQPGETKLIPVTEGPPEPIGNESDWAILWRWLRWNAVCLRGRKCADVDVDPQFAIHGKEIFVAFTCDGCGTRYLFSTKTGRSRR